MLIVHKRSLKNCLEPSGAVEVIQPGVLSNKCLLKMSAECFVKLLATNSNKKNNN